MQHIKQQRENKYRNGYYNNARTGSARLPATTSSTPIEQLHHTFGNQAVGDLLKSGAIQAKLKIGQPNDPLELEADRVADQILRMKEPGSHTSDSNVTEANNTPKQILKKTNPNNATSDSSVSNNFISGLGPGYPLNTQTREFMEPRFGHDFSQVRVHTNAHAAQTARTINARAFTHGSNIVFGAGQYQSQTTEGKRLLAHELTHVKQQKNAHPIIQCQLEQPKRGKPPTQKRLRFIPVPKTGVDNIPDHQIMETQEYRDLTDSYLKWQWKYHVTKEEALLVCRLILKYRKENNKPVIWKKGGLVASFIELARTVILKSEIRKKVEAARLSTKPQSSSAPQNETEEQRAKEMEKPSRKLATSSCEEFSGLQGRFEKEYKTGEKLAQTLVGRVITKGKCCNYFGIRYKLGAGKLWKEKLKWKAIQFDPSIRFDIRAVWDLCKQESDIEVVVSGEGKFSYSLKDLILKKLIKRGAFKDLVKLIEGKSDADFLVTVSLIAGGKSRKSPKPSKNGFLTFKGNGFASLRGGLELKLSKRWKVSVSYDAVRCDFWEGLMTLSRQGLKFSESRFFFDCFFAWEKSPKMTVEEQRDTGLKHSLPPDLPPTFKFPKIPGIPLPGRKRSGGHVFD